MFCTIYLISVANFVFGELHHPIPVDWRTTMHKNCEGMQIDDRGVETENFVRFNLAFTVIGAYVGLIVEQKCMNTR